MARRSSATKKMADIECCKGIKRRTSDTDDQNSVVDVNCEEPTSKPEQLEAKRCRAYSDFYNSDTGATGHLAISGLVSHGPAIYRI